jgi:hypothetical protein
MGGIFFIQKKKGGRWAALIEKQMRTFIGRGTGTPEEAVRKATLGIGEPTAIFFLAGYGIAAGVAEDLHRMFPNIPSMGTIGTRLTNGNVEDQGVSVVAFYGDAKVSCGLIRELSKCPIACSDEVEAKVSEVMPGRENTVCIEFCTNDEEKLVTTFTACFEKKNISLIGGTVFGAPEGKPTVVAYNGELFEDACVYALVKNTTGKIKVFKENIYKKASDSYHFATKVDTSKKAVLELDGRPAADVYSKEIGISRNEIVGNVLQNPMGRAVGNEVYISSMNDMDARGAIYNFKRINKNDCIYFLSLGDYKNIEGETRKHIKDEMPKISLVFSVDCIYRYLLYKGDHYFDTYARDMASLGNHMGLVSGGEQFNNQHVNQTMVCAVFE